MSTPAKKHRSWSPGLGTRVALSMIAAVTAACAALTLITTGWAAAQFRRSLEAAAGDAVGADIGGIRGALERDPGAESLEDLTAAGWSLDLDSRDGEALVAPVEKGVSDLDLSSLTQWGFINFTDSLVDRVPECVRPENVENWSGWAGATGASFQWSEACGDYLLAYGYLVGDDGSHGTEATPSWLAIRAIYLPHRAEENPVPALRATLLTVSAGVIAASALLALLVSASVIRPVKRAGKVATEVAEGDLSTRIPVKGNDAVATMSTAVNTMADTLTSQISELENANETQRRFVSDVAHELRTPTASLLASAEALRHPSTRDEAAELIAPQLERLAALTEDLLEISRMDAGQAVVVRHEIDLVDLIAETIAAAGATYTGPRELRISTDPVRLQAVLRNLVANAVQHGEPPITVTLTPYDAEVMLDVHDGGPGVPLELRARVFDRFVRGDESRHGNSSGLGLAIAAENAQLLGGALALLDDGVTFHLTVPRDVATGDPT